MHFHFPEDQPGIGKLESAFISANHRSDADWYGLLAFAHITMRGLSFAKFFVKKSLLYFPIFGYGMYLIGFIFVKRRWDKDRGRVEKAFSFLKRMSSNGTPISLYCFPEGSRFSTGKQQASSKFAEEHGLPRLQHVLLPRTKGFTSSLAGLDSKLDAVYDITIVYPKDKTVSLGDIVFRRGRYDIHLYVRRWDIRELPLGEEALSQWLYRVYAGKDLVIQRFYETGTWFSFRRELDMLVEKMFTPHVLRPESKAASLPLQSASVPVPRRPTRAATLQ